MWPRAQALPYEWKNSTALTLGAAVGEEAKAESSRASAAGDIGATSRNAATASASSSTALANWADTTEGVKTRLEQIRADTEREVAELAAERARSQAFTEALKPGLVACQSSHSIRAQRPPRELVFDPAAVALRDQHTEFGAAFELMRCHAHTHAHTVAARRSHTVPVVLVQPCTVVAACVQHGRQRLRRGARTAARLHHGALGVDRSQDRPPRSGLQLPLGSALTRTRRLTTALLALPDPAVRAPPPLRACTCLASL